jgi:hypothetical protein
MGEWKRFHLAEMRKDFCVNQVIGISHLAANCMFGIPPIQ